jgi:hypothetical protein
LTVSRKESISIIAMIKNITMKFRALGLAIKAGKIIYGRLLAEDGEKIKGNGYGSLASGSHGKHRHYSKPGKSGVPKARRAAKKRQKIAAKMPK